MPSIDDSKCCLVTGATSGIGRALALAIFELPSKPTVIAAGRRQHRLDELALRLETLQLDMGADHATLKKLADHIVHKYPDVRTCITFKPESLSQLNYPDYLSLTRWYLPREYNTSLIIPNLMKSIQKVRDDALDSNLETDVVSEIASEININYTAIVTLIGFLLPHFLKLGVRILPHRS